jgi:hypothetical protein
MFSLRQTDLRNHEGDHRNKQSEPNSHHGSF